ncbi:MAG: hypothetical protein RBR54_04960 [Sulfurimonas sp.]|jgi:hypothetical protein|nr:hypothetical protein [Sulfurimonas sp.]
MLMQGLSLEQAPPYKIPLFFYITGALYLVLLSLAFLFFYGEIESRYTSQALLLTHIFTLGFLLHIMMGTLFQMVPVIIGVSYKKIELNAKIIYISLNLANISIILYLFYKSNILIYIFGLSAFFSIIYFSLYSIFTIARAVEKNYIVQIFLSAQGFLLLGSLLGLISLLQYVGMIGGVYLGQTHILTMGFGWIVLLISGVALKVIPMFYVAKEYPLFCKRYFSKAIIVLILLFLTATLFELESVLRYTKIALALALLAFSLMTILLLARRKRARRDTTVQLWYFSMMNLLLGALLWINGIVFYLEIDLLLGLIFGLGSFYALINGMLYKIIPFLTWFHLSSKMIYDAEMGQVIPSKRMQWQFYLFVSSYVGFVAAFYFQVLFVIASFLFLCSSALLLYNIVLGYRYYQKMLQKTQKMV